jgi:hypothetical protein
MAMPARASISGFSLGVPSKKSINPILALKHKQVTLNSFVALCHFVARVVTSTGWLVLVVLDPSGLASQPR